ncbi:hypothetical protein EYR36_006857 [Pleurotus pulmonarius]|nr:hypothetical protein EYR36_006857 [Pleurotus pulmonarius]
MQRIMLEHLYLWKEKKLDVKFDAGRVRPTIPPDNRTAHQVCTTPSPDGQQIAAGSLKRQSQHLGPTEESKAKKQRTTKAEELEEEQVPPTLPATPRLPVGQLQLPTNSNSFKESLSSTPGSASARLLPLEADPCYTDANTDA